MKLIKGVLTVTLILMALGLISLAPAGAEHSSIDIGTIIQVNTGGENLYLRAGPATSYAVKTKIANAAHAVVAAGPQTGDGYTWWEVQGTFGRGWVPQKYIKLMNSMVPPAATAISSADPCEQSTKPYPGIEYCVRDSGSTHLLLIDLNDPHIRFQTVFADDDRNVQTNHRQTIPEMALSHPNTAAAINSDYSGAGHGPEGLTIEDGIRYDGIDRGDNDNGAVNRSSLVISKTAIDGGSLPIEAAIVRLNDDRQVIDPDRWFTASGGGPQVIFDGKWIWQRGLNSPYHNGCLPGINHNNVQDNNDIINGECFVDTGGWSAPDKRWTAMGITQDNKLIWLVSPYVKVASALETFQTMNAIKMDGGGSSQLWLNGQPVVVSSDPSPRRLASGLLIYYLHAFEVQEQTRYPVVIAGETARIELILRNAGSDLWAPGEYVLGSEENPWNQSMQFALPYAVGPGGTWDWEWTTEPLSGMGIRKIQLQMFNNGVRFPEKDIQIYIIVLPEEIKEQRAKLEQKINEWVAQGKENIEQLIIEWFQNELKKNNFCSGLPTIALPVIAIYLNQRRRKKVKTR